MNGRRVHRLARVSSGDLVTRCGRRIDQTDAAAARIGGAQATKTRHCLRCYPEDDPYSNHRPIGADGWPLPPSIDCGACNGAHTDHEMTHRCAHVPF